jgi:DNA replication factor GINS
LEGEVDLANTLREERKTAELQALDKGFYLQVGVYLPAWSRSSQKFRIWCIQRIRRSFISVKNARSASREEACLGMTREEEDIYRQMLSAIHQGRETILAHIAHTERPLTGKKDISQEYEIVRLLDSVPMFVGVDGRNYLLSKDDVVALPKVHARNLHNKKLAVQVKSRDDEK